MTHLHPHHWESFIHALIYRRIYHCVLSLAPFLPALIQSIWLGPPERKRSKKTRSPSIHPSIEIPTTISLFPLSFCWHNDAVPLTPVKRNSERHHAEIKSLYAHAGKFQACMKTQTPICKSSFFFGGCVIVIQVKEESNLVNLSCLVENYIMSILVSTERWAFAYVGENWGLVGEYEGDVGEYFGEVIAPWYWGLVGEKLGLLGL